MSIPTFERSIIVDYTYTDGTPVTDQKGQSTPDVVQIK